MAFARSDTADKFIVDRRKPHRNRDVANAVRRTRDRLSQQAGNPDFDREMLKIHAHALLNSAPAIPLLVMLIATAGLVAGMDYGALLWALVTAACYAGLYLLARRVDASDIRRDRVSRLQRLFLLAHFCCGFGWAYFATLGCGRCGFAQFPTIQAVVLLMAIAATALVASSLRGALIVTFAVPVATYALVTAQPLTPTSAIMTALLVVSLPFFTYVAQHLNAAALTILSFRSEKDGLIAELETANAVSDEARRRAEEANLAKSRFLASMSHELRTPLNAILGFSEVMANEVLGPIDNGNYRDYARDIHGSGHHLLNLINEILDLSRIEAGRYDLNQEPLDLVAVVEECCHMMELKARAKDISIEPQFEHGLPRLFADERSIRQITLNLLSNAIKFTSTKGHVRVRVGWTAGGGQYISVRDDGPGIAEEELPVVLSAFGQGSIAIKSAEQGTGLGLPIVQGLVQLHDGVFDLKSRMREGTEAVAAFPPGRVMEELPAYATRNPLAASA